MQGRTIQPDGTVVPLTGKPYEKVLVKSKTLKYNAKVFTMPDVQVGSILEYRYDLRYEDDRVVAPQWYVQQDVYVRKAHYEFVPYERGVLDAHGSYMEGQLAFASMLPPGVSPKYSQTQHMYSLDVENVPAKPTDEYMPPIDSVAYRVLFYYSAARNSDEYWKQEGKYWSKDIDQFAVPGKLGGIVGQIVAPSDTPQQKLQKIYAAVLQLENTRYTRERTSAEDKAQGIKVKTAEDIWNQKRGNPDEITLLFVGLARAAGLQAYAMAVTNRDRAFFMPSFLSMSQLDDDIAIVVLDGKEQFFDPGERYCSFGQLQWTHAMTQGLRQTDHGTELSETPTLSYKTNQMMRIASLQMAEDGKLSGQIRINMNGGEALEWRQKALSTDVTEVNKQFEERVQAMVPPGVQVKMGHFLALDDPTKVLMAQLEVSGNMGTATSKRVFLPGTFFEAGSKPLFVHETRTVPVDLEYPYTLQDSVSLTLPKVFAVESTPKNGQIPFPNNAVYSATFKENGQTLTAERLFVLANSVFLPKDYPALKDFYQKVNARDQEQLVLHPASVAENGPAK